MWASYQADSLCTCVQPKLYQEFSAANALTLFLTYKLDKARYLKKKNTKSFRLSIHKRTISNIALTYLIRPVLRSKSDSTHKLLADVADRATDFYKKKKF